MTLPDLPRASFKMTFERYLIALLIGGGGTGAYNGIATKLEGIETAIHESSATLAVALSRLSEHDRRLENLETLFLRQGK